MYSIISNTLWLRRETMHSLQCTPTQEQATDWFYHRIWADQLIRSMPLSDQHAHRTFFCFAARFDSKSTSSERDWLSLDLYRYSWAAYSRASNTQSDTHHEHTLKFFINLFYLFYSPLFSLYSSYWHIHIQTITPAQSVGFLLDTQLFRRFQFMHLFTHFFINSKMI